MPEFKLHIPHLVCLCVPPSSLNVLCGDREHWALLSPCTQELALKQELVDWPRVAHVSMV